MRLKLKIKVKADIVSRDDASQLTRKLLAQTEVWVKDVLSDGQCVSASRPLFDGGQVVGKASMSYGPPKS